MNNLLAFPREPDDLFVHVPLTLNQDYLEEILSRYLGEPVRILQVQSENVRAGYYGGVACSGSTVVSVRLDLSNGKEMHLAVKILSPDPVNLFKIDCRYDSRIAEIRWTNWWGGREKAWAPIVYDTHMDLEQREFWILREFFPQIGWPDVTETEWGHFGLEDVRLRLMVETVAEMHAESTLAIEELRRLFSEPGIRQGGECRFVDLEAALDGVIADEWLFQVVGMGEQERDQIKTYRERIADRPDWLEAWRIVCVNADLKPGNLAFRSNEARQPVLFDFGAARLAPMELELSLLLERLDADDALTETVLTWYIDRFHACTGDRISVADVRRRLPWAKPLLFLRSLVEHADALRWVQWQDRSKGVIRFFIQAVGRLLDQCDPQRSSG